jgi:methanogenic corrinoid protein MtbC1
VAEFVQFALDLALADGPRARNAAANSGELGAVQALYLQTILHGQRQAAVGIAIETVRQGHTLTDIYTDVLQVSMYEIGRLWETNCITVAQEHMATAITQYVIAHLYPLIQPVQPPRGRMVITGVEGEQHQVGPNIVADVLESAGWDVRFLGTNTPPAGVLQVIEEHRADVLGISATMLFNLPAVRRLIAEARAVPGRNLRVILGGGAFRSTPGLHEKLGASGIALDVRAALRLAATL